MSDTAVDSCNLEAVAAPHKSLFPAPTVMEIPDSIHSATDKYPALTDLTKSVLFSACFSSLSGAAGLYLSGDRIHLYLVPAGGLHTAAGAHSLCRWGLNCIHLAPAAQV